MPYRVYEMPSVRAANTGVASGGLIVKESRTTNASINVPMNSATYFLIIAPIFINALAL